jgi:hypothetical protein
MGEYIEDRANKSSSYTWSTNRQQLLLNVVHKLPTIPEVLARILFQHRKSSTDHMAAQPSDSWKLRAMSTPLVGSVQTMRVSKGVISLCLPTSLLCPTLLLLETIFFADSGLQQHSIWLIFRLHEHARFFLTTDFILETR